MVKISKQMVAQGSFGIRKIDSRGRDIGRVINVWHVEQEGQRIGTYATREAAREAGRTATRIRA